MLGLNGAFILKSDLNNLPKNMVNGSSIFNAEGEILVHVEDDKFILLTTGRDLMYPNGPWFNLAHSLERPHPVKRIKRWLYSTF